MSEKGRISIILFHCHNQAYLLCAHLEPSYRLRLNNALQGTGRNLQYYRWFEGPQHAPTWHAICYSTSCFTSVPRLSLQSVSVDGIEYGRGSGNRENQATECAARNAYQVYSQYQ
jgi:dsRNA-specific ribonuclease